MLGVNYNDQELFKFAKENYQTLIFHCVKLNSEGYWSKPEQILKQTIQEQLDLYLQALLVLCSVSCKKYGKVQRHFVRMIPDSNPLRIGEDEQLSVELVNQAKKVLSAPPILLQLFSLRDREKKTQLSIMFMDTMINIVIALSYLEEREGKGVVRFLREYIGKIQAFLGKDLVFLAEIDDHYVQLKIQSPTFKTGYMNDEMEYAHYITDHSKVNEKTKIWDEPENKVTAFSNKTDEPVSVASTSVGGKSDEHGATAFSNNETNATNNDINSYEANATDSDSNVYEPTTSTTANYGINTVSGSNIDSDLVDTFDKSEYLPNYEDQLEEEEEPFGELIYKTPEKGDNSGRTSVDNSKSDNSNLASIQSGKSDNSDQTTMESTKSDLFTIDRNKLTPAPVKAPEPKPEIDKDEIAKEIAKAKLELEEAKDAKRAQAVEKLMDQLNELVGLESVKAEMQSLVNLIKVRKMRQNYNLPQMEMSYHMVFTGAAGTGKTTVARLVSEIYKELGVLSKGTFVETDRAGLVAGYLGQTAMKVKEVVNQALGGVLFIDEAYSLSSRDAGDDYGIEAIDTLVKEMEDHRNDLVVIVAGYQKEMERFLKSNTGLISRFNKFIDFPDYTNEELVDILKMMATKSSMEIEDDAIELIEVYLECMDENAKREFGNARGIRNLFERIVTKQADRIVTLTKPSVEDLKRIVADDVDL
ncbi:MAG: AAA family ATPase [Lachnospiraceae bacterium]|nr:AAA family ATPase [Lachnospiraceae bacterium]